MSILTLIGDEFDGKGKVLGVCSGVEIVIALHMVWMGALLLSDTAQQRNDIILPLQWIGFGWAVGLLPLGAGASSAIGIVMMAARKYGSTAFPRAESATRAGGSVLAAVIYTWCAYVLWEIYPRGWIFWLLMVGIVFGSLRAAWLGGNRA